MSRLRSFWALLSGPATITSVVSGGSAIVFVLVFMPGVIRPKPSFDPPVIQPVEQHIQGDSITTPVDCSKVACIALTFDDGPSSYTSRVLDILEDHNAKATFFVLGSKVSGEHQLRRIHAAGNEIGNHTWSHPYLTGLSLDRVSQEVESTQLAVVMAGAPAPTIFRPPYGDINQAVQAHIPLSTIRWNIDPEDWNPKKRDQLVNHIAHHAKPGAVILLHDTEATTVDKLDQVITELQAANYSLVTVSQLLNLAPGQQGVFFGR